MSQSSSASRLSSVEQLDFVPQSPVFPSPADWRDHVLYLLMIDRFDNNADDIPPYDPASTPRHPGRDRAPGAVFQGGNLKGITRRLDYIRNLGCSAVWITPPFKQRAEDREAYPGYSMQDFLAIDPRFGTMEDLKELVDQAHRRKMYVILDIVLNHTGDVWGYPEDKSLEFKSGKDPYPFGFWRKSGKNKGESEEFGPDDAVWPRELQDPECFNRRGHIRDISLCEAGSEECIRGDFYSLKDLNTDNPKTLDVLAKVYKYWIAAADIDGYRIDTVKHVDPRAMRDFCNAIHEYATRIGKRNFLIYGEIAGGDDLLHKYIGGNNPIEEDRERYPRFDAALDFPLYSVLDDVLKKQKPYIDLRNRYEAFQHYFRDFAHATHYYITFVDNHDQPGRAGRRFLAGAEDPKLAALAIGYLLCNMGIPCIYYGTEQGFDAAGESERDVRHTMFGGTWGAFDTEGVQFFNPKHPIYKTIAAVEKIRRDEPALRYGRQYFRQTSSNGKDFGWGPEVKNIVAFSRVLDTDEVLVALNLDDEEHDQHLLIDAHLSPPGCTMADLLNGGNHRVKEVPHEGGGAVRVKMAPYSMAILRRR